MNSKFEQLMKTSEEASKKGNYQLVFNSFKEAVDFLKDHITLVDDALNTIDQKEQTIATTFLLSSKLSATSIQTLQVNDSVLFKIEDFVEKADKNQVQLFPDIFAALYSQYTEVLVKLNLSHRGIYTLREAVYTLRETPSHLTTLHADLCRLCLHAKNLKPALPILDKFISKMSNEGNGTFDVKAFLLFYYYGGMIHTAVKNYDKALYFFEMAITVPATAVSQIVLEAYKKYVLVLLLNDAKLPYNLKAHLLPKQTPQIVAKFIKKHCEPYTELANIFETGDCDKFKSAMEEHKETFEADKNFGLTKQALNALYKKNIGLLTKAFITLSLEDVALRCKLKDTKEAESLLFKMVADGEIGGRIDKKEGMVTFTDGYPKFNTRKEFEELEKQILEVVEISDMVTEMDRDIESSVEYIKRLNKQHEESGAPGSSNNL